MMETLRNIMDREIEWGWGERENTEYVELKRMITVESDDNITSQQSQSILRHMEVSIERLDRIRWRVYHSMETYMKIFHLQLIYKF